MPRRILLFLAPVALLATALTATSVAAPSARFSVAPGDPYVGERVQFDAAATACRDAPCTYSWSDEGPDGPGGTGWALGSGPELGFTFRIAGTKYVRLTVRNAAGETSSTVRAVTVAAGTRPETEPAPSPSPSPSPSPAPSPAPTPAPGPAGCDRTATPSTFAAQVAAADAGDAICLQTGSYGTWTGTDKAITVKADSGARPSMKFSFGSGDRGFTLDGIVDAGGTVNAGAEDITVRDSTFTSQATVDGTTPSAGIVFDGNSHNNISGSQTANRFLAAGAVTVRNSVFEGGGSDGVRLATKQVVQVIGNTFRDITDDGSGNHTDMLQIYGGANAVIRGNLFKQTVAGETQVMAAYDGTSGNLIEDNVIDVTGRPWGIELYSDTGSVVRHNTVVHHAGCPFNLPCGLIDINRKSQDPAGSGTVVTDNVATGIVVNNGSTVARRSGNLLRQGAAAGDLLGVPLFAGGTAPTVYAGYRLAVGSPGALTASDGLDAGIR